MQSVFLSDLIASEFLLSGRLHQTSHRRTHHPVLCPVPPGSHVKERTYGKSTSSVLLPILPMTSSASVPKSTDGSLMACSYRSLSHISIMFTAADMTIFFPIPANATRSFGRRILPELSSSTGFTPALNMRMKSTFFFLNRLSLLTSF